MWEIILCGIVLYVIFRDLLEAKAEELQARARLIDLEVEMKEHNFHYQDEDPGTMPGEDSQEVKEVK
jgi:hypothetical protein